MKQMTMFDTQLNQTYIDEPFNPEDGVYIRWLKYRKKNPHIEADLINLVRLAQTQGLMHYGIHGLFNKLRWDVAVKTRGDTFKISNDYGPYYARLLTRKYPETRRNGGFFTLRRMAWESPAEFDFYQQIIDEYEDVEL